MAGPARSARAAGRPGAGVRRGRGGALCLPAALAAAAVLGLLGVACLAPWRRGDRMLKVWRLQASGSRAAEIFKTMRAPRLDDIGALEGDDITRSLPGDELGEEVPGIDLSSSDVPDAEETGEAKPGEPAEGEEGSSSGSVQEKAAEEEGGKEDEDSGEKAQTGTKQQTETKKQTGTKKREKKKNGKKKRLKGGGVDGPTNWFRKTRKKKKGSNTHRILRQVNLEYSGGLPLILNKQEAASFDRDPGVSPVRCRVRKQGKPLTRADKFCRVAKQATRFVTTDRVMDFLPDTDIDHRQGTQRRYGRCALVGNSGTLVTKEFGEDINAHDQIFRFNLAPTVGYEKHVGSRTTHELLNPENIRKIVAEPEKLQMLQTQGARVTVLTFDDYLQFTGKLLMKKKWRRSSREDGMHSQLLVEKHMEVLAAFHKAAPDVRIEYIAPEFIAWSYERYAALERYFREFSLGKFKGERPMSGFHTLLYLINTCEEVHLYGFSNWKRGDAAPYKYFNDFQPKGGLHSFGFAQKIMEMIEEEYAGVFIHS